jgi:hypothetical protein
MARIGETERGIFDAKGAKETKKGMSTNGIEGMKDLTGTPRQTS